MTMLGLQYQTSSSVVALFTPIDVVAQALSTYQLSEQHSSEVSLDILTGFQLADGALRLVVLEGPAEGLGMTKTVPGIAR